MKTTKYIALEIEANNELEADIFVSEILAQIDETPPLKVEARQVEILENSEEGWFLREVEAINKPNMNNVFNSAKYSAKWYMDRLGIEYCEGKKYDGCPTCHAANLVYDAMNLPSFVAETINEMSQGKTAISREFLKAKQNLLNNKEGK